MQPLNCVLKCRAIDFLENIGAYLDDVIRSHGQEEPVKGGMMQSTKRNSIANHRLTLRLRIRQDVGRVKQLTMQT